MDAVAKKIEIREVSQRKTAYLFIKRVFDIVLSLVLIVVLLPLLLRLDRQAASSEPQLLQTKLLYLRCLFDFLGVLSEVRPPNTLSGKKHADTTALRIKSYLDVNFRTPFSVQDLCAQFFLSQRQLDRIFCRAYGMTVHAYLTELRRHYACALLEKGEFSARRAALESGFSGYQQMRRAVRRKQP